MTWLMRSTAAPSVIDGLLAFQITGSPLPALLAVAAPVLRMRRPFQGQYHV